MEVVPFCFFPKAGRLYEFNIYLQNKSTEQHGDTGDLHKNNIVLYAGSGGYGDAVYALPVALEFVAKQRDEKDVIIVHSNQTFFQIFSLFFKNATHILLPPYTSLTPYLQNCIENEYLTSTFEFKKFIRKSESTHVINNFRSRYGIDTLVDELLQKYDTLYTSKIFIKPELRQELDKIKAMGYQHIISTQFFTANSIERSWTKDHAKTFCMLCSEYNIAILNLAKGDDDLKTIDNVYDFSNYTVPELFPLIREVDLHVGIDSCFGHIAGLQNCPSVTIWGQNTPTRVLWDVGMDLASLRALRNNLSIYGTTGYSSHITPSMVIEATMQILDGKCILQKHHLTYADS
jgi:hypothetical protein